MKRWLMVSGLAVLNLLLGTAVYQRLGGEQKAQAQIGAQKAELATVAGSQNGQTCIYLMDVNTGLLLAYRLDIPNQKFQFITKRQVAADLQRVGP